MVKAALRIMRFYAHESCGWCIPCREGTTWLRKILQRFHRGQGTAKATAQMKVEAAEDGSTVTIVTDYHVAGRVAQFGRGVMQDVSKRMVNEMATCIKANLESAPPTSSPGGAATGSDPTPAPHPVEAPRQINAFGLLWHLLAVRIGRLFGRDSA